MVGCGNLKNEMDFKKFIFQEKQIVRHLPLLQKNDYVCVFLSSYNKEDIYNADETGLFFRMEPNQTLSTGAVAGRKKVRISCNMDIKFINLINTNYTFFVFVGQKSAFYSFLC